MAQTKTKAVVRKCGTCGKMIPVGVERITTPSDEWFKRVGVGSPQPSDLVYLCGDACSKRFQRKHGR